jgi:cytidylate kinase
MRKLIIAIDGPVGSGKSSVARRVAALLGYTYLDTGAMYRAMALKALRTATPLDDVTRLEALGDTTRIELATRDGGGQRVLLDGADVSSDIRTPEVAQATSHRRFQEHVARGEQMTLEQVIAELRERDERDMKRITSPLKPAPDAVLVDSTAMQQEEVAKAARPGRHIHRCDRNRHVRRCIDDGVHRPPGDVAQLQLKI